MNDSQRARRDFLEKAGKLAAYTPPLMLALLIPGEHAIASGTYKKEKKEKIKIK
jgi:hypothetical protein